MAATIYAIGALWHLGPMFSRIMADLAWVTRTVTHPRGLGLLPIRQESQRLTPA